MRIYYAVLFVLPILIAFSQASQTVTVNIPFTSPAQTVPLTATGQSTYPLSPAKPVYDYNMQNALYLITCPQAPQLSNLDNQQLFTTTGFQQFGGWMISGNSCQAYQGVSSYPVTATLTDAVTVPSNQKLPTATSSNVSVNLTNAVYTNITNLGFSPEVISNGKTFLSSDFNSQSYIFDSVPIRGQQGLWTWNAKYADLSYLNSKLPVSATNSAQGAYVYQGANSSCQYTYTLNSKATLVNVQNNQIPFAASQGNTMQLGLLPYLIYNANITNSAPSNEFNVGLSYDIYGPINYYSPQSRIEPFTINSLGLFFGNYSGSLAYVNTNGGVQVALSSADSNIGVLFPQSNSFGTATVGGCPNKVYPTGDTTSQLTVKQAVACAQNAGFTGAALVNFVEIGYEESSWHPGETEFGQVAGSPPACIPGPPGAPTSCAAVGILQLGCSGDSWCPFNVGAYSPSTCSTYGQGSEWQGIYMNPTCAYQWAYAYYQVNGYQFWGGTSSACNRDCNIAVSEDPNILSQIQAVLSGGSNTNSTLQPAASSSYSISLKPISIASTPNGYVFVLASNAGSGSSSSSNGAASCSANAVCAAAYTQLGVPYCWGGEAPKGTNPFVGTSCNDGSGLTPGISTTSGGFDCSGLVQWAAEQAGFTLAAHYTVTQWNSEVTHITQAQALPGDLVYFNVPGESPEPAHVGICYNVGCTQMIDAPHTGAYVRVESIAGFGSPEFGRIPGNNNGGSVGTLTPSNTSPPSNVSNQSRTPQQQYENGLSNTGLNIYVLKVIPQGYYNTSLYQPDTVQSSSNGGAFTNNWNTYWNNVLGLQGQNVYVVNVIPVSSSYQIYSALHAASGGSVSWPITPMNISTDSYGDLYLTGYDQNNNWIIKMSNTIGNGPLSVTAEPVCPSTSVSVGLSSSTPPPPNVCSNIWPEIAVSPTGSQVYLANPNSGMMPVFDGGSLLYQTSISLGFGSDSQLYSMLAAPGQQVPAANIIDYFQNGGLYNITTQCGGSNQQPCSNADNIMKHIFNQYYSVLNSSSGATIPSQDTLDKANWPSGNTNSNYHHPLGISDVNGYLYVLDDWTGVGGEICTYEIFGKCPPGNSVGGILFNVLDMRVINSSGVDVPIVPTYYNDLWYYTSSGHYNLKKFTTASQNFYPPFGWIISADVQAMNGKSSVGLFGGGNGPTGPDLQVCSGDSSVCSPINTRYYSGSLLPIGPELKNWGSCATLPGQGYSAISLESVGFSVNVNSTATILIPSSNNISNPSCHANQNNELIIAHLNPQNYTKTIGGYNPIPFSQKNDYQCYTGHTFRAPNYCNFNSNVDNLLEPVYTLPNPFEFNENIGGYQGLALDTILSSSFSGGSGIGSSVGTCNPPGSTNCTINSGAQSNLSGQANSYGTATSGFNINNLNSLNTGVSTYATTLNTVISGYTILPFTYTYKLSWYLSGVNSDSSSSSCNPPPASLTNLETPQTSTHTIYTYSTSSIQNSNHATAQVEGGATYVRSGLNATYYYVANLSSIIVPGTLLYNVLTNRLFGKTYINSSISPTTNAQQVVNATNQYSYGAVTYTQGALPGYKVVVATPTPTAYGPQQAAPLANISKVYSVKNDFSVTLESPILVTLFNWFKLPVNNEALSLQLNGSVPSGSESAYGYHRLVYVYNDRFNNTIYMPLDADLANITHINLNVSPAVNSINVNQTTIYINGSVSWTPPFTTNNIPLNGGYIYLYYDTNLNFIGFNAINDPVDAATCAFTNATPPGPGISARQCQLANPVWNGLQYNSNPQSCPGAGCINGLFPDGSPYISANIVTYSPAFNSQGVCPMPANSLLAPINAIYTLCNIYPSQASKFNLPNICPTSAQGNTEYCDAVFENGTGICTPQMGLIGIYPTNSLGYFSANVVACGSGSPKIIAQYYGTPSPEPIYASQSPIGAAANPSSGQYISFLTANYAWTPTQVSEGVQIGSFLLSIGSIKYLLVFIVAACAAIILYGMLHKGHTTRSRSRK